MTFLKKDEQLTGKADLPLETFKDDLKHTYRLSNLNLFD